MLKILMVLSLLVVGCAPEQAKVDIINGSDGVNGTNGLSNMITVERFSTETNGCKAGTLILVGLDTNRNGKLETEEVTSRSHICDGTNGKNSRSNDSDDNDKKHCNNGGGNGSEGCSSSDNGNDDE